MSSRQHAALYARFSTDLQNDRSVDDQLDLCATFARSQGYEVAGQYHDRARSGSTLHGRDGLSRLLDDARAGRFSVVVVEALDRLSRDQEDLAGLHKRLSFLGIDIVAVHDGRADAIQVGIRGLVSTLFLTDLKHKIRRGMGGVIADGRTAGGKAYGYRPTPGQPGVLQIDAAEAAVVRRIFTEYAAGRLPRDIARSLNDDSVPPPRKGGTWNASTINGSRTRGNGILHNPIYAGEIIWNRLRMVRDPDTGKRISRPNPPEDWKRANAPHLRIIDPGLWVAVQARKEGRSAGGTPHSDPRARRLLSGLLRCAQCGGGMTMHDKRAGVVRIRCSTAKESGSCGNQRRYRLDLIERAVVDALVERLSQPDAARAWLESIQTEERDGSRRRAKAQKAVAEARAKVDRLQMNLIEGRIDTAFFDAQIGPARAALAEAQAALDEAPAGNVVTLHPAALSGLSEMLAIVAKHLPDIDPREDREAYDAIRSLIRKVVVVDRADGGVDCEITGTLAPLVAQGMGGMNGSGGPLQPDTPRIFIRIRAA